MHLSRASFLRTLLPGVLAVSAALALTGCPSGSGGGTTGGGAAGGGGDILVGHYTSLTGDNATFGQDTKQGVDLAVQELNEAGGVLGRKFKVDTQDDQSKPEEASTLATRFAQDPNVVAVLGEIASSISKAAAPTLDSAGIPMITPSSTNETVTQIGPHIFRVCFIDPFQGYVMAKFAHDTLKLNKVAIFRDEKNDYSVGLANNFKQAFTKMGGQIVSELSFKQGDTDFRAQLSQIKSAGPQAIYVPGYYGDVGPIARQARELGIDKKVPLMGGDGWDSDALVKGAGGPGGALEGSYFSNHYSKDDQSPRARKFVDAYKKVYSKEPSGLAALGYDAMMILADAIKRANSTDREAVTKALAETKGFPGVTGDITIDADRNAAKPAVVLQIKGTAFDYVSSVAPEGAAGGETAASPAAGASPAASGSPAAPAAATP
jgi:branched-chain amino acid transport system substrate-binding protein